MAASPIVREHQGAHAREHSLEMQLPFVTRLAPDAKIVPLVMGYQTAATARALGATDAVVLKYADSGDVSGDKTAVVGYLAAAFGTRDPAARRARVQRTSP
jgi:predicted class III extradiol MEMO1 family dioxygenase